MAEFDASIGGGEAPVDLCRRGVPGLLPGGYRSGERRFIRDAPVQTLTAQDGQFDFGHIEPGAMFGGVMKLQAIADPLGFGGLEGGVERGGRVVEVAPYYVLAHG